MTALVIILAYLAVLLVLGVASSRLFRGTATDYFVASHSIGPVLLLMSLFGTTMTAFALVGSTGEAYRTGIGVYGKLASWSGLVHSAVFFFLGTRLWAMGRRHGHVTQVAFFRDRFDSPLLGSLLFPVLVALVVPYLLIGLLGAGSVVQSLTQGAFPEAFAATGGGIPPWLGNAVICGVVLTYVFFGGLRGAAWANTLQTAVFMVTGLVAFVLIARALGGMEAAMSMAKPEKLVRGDQVQHLQFFSYVFVPLSVGMFPHVFQHWLTARSARTFRLAIVAHPIFILIVWVPCILIGVWATGAMLDGRLIVPVEHPKNAELALMVRGLTNDVVAGLLGAGILAAIMSSLDSQFFCLGTMFTNDIVVHHFGPKRFNDRQHVALARGFICLVVAVCYGLSLGQPRRVFTLGVWCFSGFAALVPIALAAVYWRRATAAGAIAAVLATVASWFAFFRAAEYGRNPDYLVLGMLPVTFILAASILALVVVSWLTRPPSAATIRRFFGPTTDSHAAPGGGKATT